MIFAVSMTFIDQTIVSIAVPQIQKELGLTSTGVQWVVNASLLSLAALFAFGGSWPARSGTGRWSPSAWAGQRRLSRRRTMPGRWTGGAGTGKDGLGWADPVRDTRSNTDERAQRKSRASV